MHLPFPNSDVATARAPLVAVTGATGFIGRHLIAALVQAGWRVRLLLRREPSGAEWRQSTPEVVAGSLDNEAAVARLVEGVDAVIHLAGLIKAARRADFFAVNEQGVARIARATKQLSPDAHFLLVSSLAAREPLLSDYAASKRAGEAAALDAMGARVEVDLHGIAARVAKESCLVALILRPVVESRFRESEYRPHARGGGELSEQHECDQAHDGRRSGVRF